MRPGVNKKKAFLNVLIERSTIAAVKKTAHRENVPMNSWINQILRMATVRIKIVDHDQK